MVSGLCARGPEEKFALILPFLSPILLYLLRILQFSPVFSAFSLRFKLLGNAKEASPQQFGANFLRHMVTLIFRLQAWAWLASISSSTSKEPQQNCLEPLWPPSPLPENCTTLSRRHGLHVCCLSWWLLAGVRVFKYNLSPRSHPLMTFHCETFSLIDSNPSNV